MPGFTKGSASPVLLGASLTLGKGHVPEEN